MTTEPTAEPEAEAASPIEEMEDRIAQLEESHQLTQRQIADFKSAVGRAQALADRFSKGEVVDSKVQSAMSDVYELLGTMSESIDEAALPRDVKARVAQARESARRAAQTAEVRRAAEEAASKTVPQPEPDMRAYTDALEAAVVTEMQSYGLTQEQIDGMDWQRANTLLHTQGVDAMYRFFRTNAAALVKGEEPRRRPRQAPAPAGVANTRTEMDEFLDPKTSWARKLELMPS